VVFPSCLVSVAVAVVVSVVVAVVVVVVVAIAITIAVAVVVAISSYQLCQFRGALSCSSDVPILHQFCGYSVVYPH